MSETIHEEHTSGIVAYLQSAHFDHHLSGISHCDETCCRTDSKGTETAQFFPWSQAPLNSLLDSRVAPEANSRVGGLPREGWHEALIDPANSTLSEDASSSMDETPILRYSSFLVVY